jgi:hypothetical protein
LVRRWLLIGYFLIHVLPSLLSRPSDGGVVPGIAFVDVKTEADRKRLLRLHHTKMGERKINVERVNFNKSGEEPAEGDEAGDGGDDGETMEGEGRPGTL